MEGWDFEVLGVGKDGMEGERDEREFASPLLSLYARIYFLYLFIIL